MFISFIEIQSLSSPVYIQLKIYEYKKLLPVLWSISIFIALVKRLNLLKYDEEDKKNESNSSFGISKTLETILTRDHLTTISSIFEFIVGSLKRRQFYDDLITDYNRTLVPLIRDVTLNVAAFIDNIDECFEGAERDIWYLAQNSLIKAVYDIIRINNKIKLAWNLSLLIISDTHLKQ